MLFHRLFKKRKCAQCDILSDKIYQLERERDMLEDLVIQYSEYEQLYQKASRSHIMHDTIEIAEHTTSQNRHNIQMELADIPKLRRK